MPSAGFGTRDPNNTEAADLRLRTHDHRDRFFLKSAFATPQGFMFSICLIVYMTFVDLDVDGP